MDIGKISNNPTSRFVAMGVVVTVLVLGLLVFERSGIPDPSSLPVFYRLFLVEDLPAAFLMLAALLCVAPWPVAQRVAAMLAVQMGRRPLAISGIVFAVLCAGSLLVYRARPLVMDEYVPWTQSHIFISGHLSGRFPSELMDWLVPRGFQGYFFVVSKESGEFASSYWPGLALLFTPFMALGIPWACNPAVGAATVWVIHRLTLEISKSSEAAGTAVLFTLASATFAVNAISFYSMPAHLLCNAVYALLLLRPTPHRALVAGAIGGLALTLHNPSRHAVFALPWLVWLLWGWRWRAMLAISAGYLPWIIVVGFGWNYFRGSITTPVATVAPVVSSGFADALALLRLFELPGPVQFEDWIISLAKAWLWATPLLLLLASLGYSRHRLNVHVRLLYASLIVTILARLLVPVNQGHGWGFRYLHGTWFVLPVLAALVVSPAEDEVVESKGLGGPLAWTRGASLAGLLVLLPYFTWQVAAFIDDHLKQLPTAVGGQPRIVLINPGGYYSVDLVQNDPYLRDDVIRMVSQGELLDRQMLASHFPDLVLLSQDSRGSVWGYNHKGFSP